MKVLKGTSCAITKGKEGYRPAGKDGDGEKEKEVKVSEKAVAAVKAQIRSMPVADLAPAISRH